jgi:hypothetical protein
MKFLNLGLCVQCLRLIGARPQSKQDPFRSWSNRIHYPLTAVRVSSSLSRSKPRPLAVGSPIRGDHWLVAEQPRARPASLFSNPNKATPIMNTPYSDQTVRTKEQEAVADDRRTLESVSIPIGSFSGSEDRIVRIRKGQIVPADTGDQGGGQN